MFTWPNYFTWFIGNLFWKCRINIWILIFRIHKKKWKLFQSKKKDPKNPRLFDLVFFFFVLHICWRHLWDLMILRTDTKSISISMWKPIQCASINLSRQFDMSRTTNIFISMHVFRLWYRPIILRIDDINYGNDFQSFESSQNHHRYTACCSW